MMLVHTHTTDGGGGRLTDVWRIYFMIAGPNRRHRMRAHNRRNNNTIKLIAYIIIIIIIVEPQAHTVPQNNPKAGRRRELSRILIEHKVR